MLWEGSLRNGEASAPSGEFRRSEKDKGGGCSVTGAISAGNAVRLVHVGQHENECLTVTELLNNPDTRVLSDFESMNLSIRFCCTSSDASHGQNCP